MQPRRSARITGSTSTAVHKKSPVIDALLDGGIAVTAIHNHLLNDNPRLTYVHFHGMGSDAGLAKVLRKAVGLMAPAPPPYPPPDQLPLKELDRILGRAGKINVDLYQFAIPRAETIREHGMEVPPAMGTATAINFRQGRAEHAVIAGDFVMTAEEVDPVMRALRRGGIQVTALHSHMIGETPRLFFMHFWADDDAVKLAKTLRAALDRMNVKR